MALYSIGPKLHMKNAKCGGLSEIMKRNHESELQEIGN